MKKVTKKPLAAAFGAAVLATAIAPAASADTNPFAADQLSSGYDLVNMGGHAKKGDKEGSCGEGKCGEGKCGGEKGDKEGKCGEGKCGG